MEQATEDSELAVTHSLPLSYVKQFLQCQKDMEAYVERFEPVIEKVKNQQGGG